MGPPCKQSSAANAPDETLQGSGRAAHGHAGNGGAAAPSSPGRAGGGRRRGAAQVPAAISAGAARRRGCPMAAPTMAEPRSKRPRFTLPACSVHRPVPGSRVRQNFPAAVEEGLCGVTGALLELAYSLQALVRRREGRAVGDPGGW